MAQVLRIVDGGGTDILNLLSGALQITPGGWVTRRSKDVIVERMSLVATGTDAAIRAGEVALDQFIEKVSRYRDTLEVDEYWLNARSDTETSKRSLIIKGDLIQLSRASLITHLLGGGAGHYSLVLERLPFWEAETTTPVELLGTTVYAWGGVKDASSVGGGSLAARISGLDISGINGAGGPLDRVWFGVKPTRDGVSGFVPVWEMEWGTPGTDTALGSEVGASPSGSSVNNKLTTTFSTTTMVKRAEISVFDAITNAGGTPLTDHHVGRFLVLLRCKVSSGSTIGVQMKTGLQGGTNRAPGRIVYVDNTSYRLIPLGHITIPSQPWRESISTAYTIRQTLAEIHASVVTANGGTDLLELDAIGIVPAEHFVYAEGADVLAGAAWENTLYFRTLPDGAKAVGCQTSGAAEMMEVDYDMRDFRFPVEGGLCVLFGERTASHVLTDQVKFWLTFYKTYANRYG
jgi:hypothetical protein